jgi:hypothetical protein
MRKVGYIAGDTLEAIQDQWVELLNADVDVILFDRTFLETGFSMSDPENSSPEKEEMWKYVETMRAAQDASGNFDNYQSFDDLVEDDRLMITSLDVLYHAKPSTWSDVLALHQRGIGLVVLANRFDSSGSFGDVMLEMMNKLYEFGLSRGEVQSEDSG